MVNRRVVRGFRVDVDMMNSYEVVEIRLLLREAAGCFNTVVGPPAAFPFRVLYDCAPPGHRNDRHKKTAGLTAAAAAYEKVC